MLTSDFDMFSMNYSKALSILFTLTIFQILLVHITFSLLEKVISIHSNTCFINKIIRLIIVTKILPD